MVCSTSDALSLYLGNVVSLDDLGGEGFEGEGSGEGAADGVEVGAEGVAL